MHTRAYAHAADTRMRLVWNTWTAAKLQCETSKENEYVALKTWQRNTQYKVSGGGGGVGVVSWLTF